MINFPWSEDLSYGKGKHAEKATNVMKGHFICTVSHKYTWVFVIAVGHVIMELVIFLSQYYRLNNMHSISEM